MVPRPSPPKIRHSLWHRLLRPRQRSHAHQTQVKLRRRTSAPTDRPARRKKLRVSPPEIPALPVPFYVHLVRLLVLVLGTSAIAGTTLSLLQSMPRPPRQNINQKHIQPTGDRTAPMLAPKK